MYTVLLRGYVDNPNKTNPINMLEMVTEQHIKVVADRYSISERDSYKFYKNDEEVARINKIDVIAILAE